MAKAKTDIDILHDPLLEQPEPPPDVPPDDGGRIPFHQHAHTKGIKDWHLAGAASLAGWGIGRVVTEEEFDAAIAAYSGIAIRVS